MTESTTQMRLDFIVVRQQAAYVHSLYADRNSLRIIDTTEAGETGQAQVSTGKAGESGQARDFTQKAENTK